MSLVDITGTSEKDRKNATEIFKRNDINEILKFLDNEQNVHFPGEHGEIALHWAAFYGNEKLVKELFARKVDVNLADRENQRTPIVWAEKQRKINKTRSEEYNRVIQILVDNKADPTIPDHTRRNAYDHDNQSPYRFMQTKTRERNDEFSLSLQATADKPKSSLELDGDDSSDEEVTDTRADPLNQAGLFTRACLFEDGDVFDELVKGLKVSQDDIRLMFMVHANGLAYLYSSEVNKFYYHHCSGKKSLGNNQISDENLKLMRSWIGAALKEATIKVIYHGEGLTSKQENHVAKLIYGEEKESAGVVDDCVENIRLIMRKDFTEAKEQCNDVLKKLQIPKKELEAIRKADPQLKGRKQSSIVEASPERIIPIYIKSISPKDRKDNEPCLNFCLLHLINRFKGNNMPELNKAQQKIITAFDLFFLVALDMLRGKFDINFIRGRSGPYIIEPFQYGYAAVGLFSSIRLANRVVARTGKELEQNLRGYAARTGDASFVATGQTKLGHYIHQFTQWHLVKGQCIQMKDELTTYLVRSQYVGHTNGSYKNLSNSISEFCGKLAISDADIAKWLREIVNGEMQSEIIFIKKDKSKIICKPNEHKEFAKFLAELAVLLFVCEPMRNPAAFICHQMLLDVIEFGNMNWKEALASKGENNEDGGVMPMSMVEAVGCARYFHEKFASSLPYPYKYAGDATTDLARGKEMVTRTTALIYKWYLIKRKRAGEDVVELVDKLILKDGKIDDISVNIEKAYGHIMEQAKTWYPALKL